MRSIDHNQIFNKFPKGIFLTFSDGLNQKSLVIHAIALLLVMFAGKIGIIIWFYTTLLYAANFILNRQHRSLIPAYLLYIIPLETFGRILRASPLIPYEMGKYFVFAILMFLLVTLKIKKGFWGFLLIAFCIPGALLVGDARPFNDIVFNLFGLLNMGLGAIVFSNFAISSEQLRRTINIAIWPILVLLVFLIIKTPDLSEVEFELGANSATTGGFGSNQVATILGLGLVLFLIHYTFNWRFAEKRWVDLFIIGLILFWGLLSFSRGGIIGAVLAFIAVNIFSKNRPGYTNPRKLKMSFVIPAVAIFCLVFYVGNIVTDGVLMQRYTGETDATSRGLATKDLNRITSGRSNILVRDYNIWMDHFVLGVGVGQADDVGKRDYGDEHIAHVEFSRLLAEHGLFGLFIIIILVFVPLTKTLQERIPIKRSWMLILLTLSLFSTFHSATRTLITPVLFGLAFLNIYESKRVEQQPEDVEEEEEALTTTT